MLFSYSITELMPALLAVQQRLEPIQKDKTNPHLKNKYASLEAITDFLRPLLSEFGLVLVQDAGDLNPTTNRISTRVIHAQSGQFAEASVVMPLGLKAQDVGGAITYGRRYSLSCLFALTTEDDNDGHETGTTQRKQARAAQKESATVQRVTAGAVKHDEVKLPAMKGVLNQYKDKPLKDIPTAALEEAYLRVKDATGKMPTALRGTLEFVLEDRRIDKPLPPEKDPLLFPSDAGYIPREI